ncbi:MAG: hypothetical protein WDW38_003647 [Sanguina aurantia]
MRAAVKQEKDASHNLIEKIKVNKIRVKRQRSITMSLNTSTLTTSGDWVRVSWGGVSDPAGDDWVGLLVPATADPSATAPAKFKLASSDPEYLRSGSGSVEFKVLNYRQDAAFMFFRGGFEKPVAVAVSPVLVVANPNQPLQGHLSLTGVNSEMAIQWSTHNSSRPQVQWRPANGSAHPYPHTADASSSSFAASDMCDAPASTVGWVDPGLQHMAVMAGLLPGVRYFYRYGDTAWGFSPEFSFLSPPLVGPGSTVRMLALADMGQAEVDNSSLESEMLASLNTSLVLEAQLFPASSRFAQSAHATATANSSKPPPLVDYSLLLHNGDLSYAQGYSTQWDNFHAQIQPVATAVPYMVNPGNHERGWAGSGGLFDAPDSGGECGVVYQRRFVMPGTDVKKQWYSFNHGPMHILQYSTEVDFMPGSDQHKFISQDLQNVDRTVTPWVIVGGHRPVYISAQSDDAPDGNSAVSKMQREGLEGLFMANKVDLLLHGHHHTYQRTCPVYQGQCMGLDPDGSPLAPIYVVIGNAGAGLSTNFLTPDPDWLQAMNLWWGILRLEINGTSLHAELVSDKDGSVQDSFTITKPSQWGQRYMTSKLNSTGSGGNSSGSSSGSGSHISVSEMDSSGKGVSGVERVATPPPPYKHHGARASAVSSDP